MVEQESPFAVDNWEDITGSEIYYGELTSFPHTFEFFVEELTPLVFDAGVRSSKDQVSVLLVRELDRGVAEVMRLTPQTASTTRERDWLLGLSFVRYASTEIELQPGRYRLEVSTPENNSRYQLRIGAKPSKGGLLHQYRELFQAQSFYSTWLGAVRSPLIFIPLTLLGYWWYRRRKSYA